MAVPPQSQLHRPILEIASKYHEPSSDRDFLNSIVNRLSLRDDDLKEKTSTGASRVRTNISFALSQLKRAGLLYRPSRGRYLITAEGRDFLEKQNGVIRTSVLRDMSYQMKDGDNFPEPGLDVTPDEMMADGYRTLQANLADELLESLSEVPPDSFERLVLDLLEEMGYGKGDLVGGSGDGGIDGIINQDALGLEKVYIQAKRWQSQVGEPEIRNFSGSLDARGASKGVFVTTSSFSKTAEQTANRISAGSKFIRLIDGGELAKLMIDHDIGVITQRTYKIKKLDENYFAPEA